MVADLSELPPDAFEGALRGYLHPLARLVSADAVTVWAKDRVRCALDHGGQGWGVVEDGRLVALAVLEPQPWETRFFGLSFGAIPIWWIPGDDAAVVARSRCLLERLLGGESYATIAATIEASQLAAAHALMDTGFRLVDTKVTYALDPRRAAPAPPGVEVADCPRSERDEVIRLAREVFTGYRSRFTADSSLPAAARAQFYETWMRNSFEGFAEAVLVARVRGRLAGFCTYKRVAFPGARLGQIDLVGTAPDFRGQGVFDALVAEAARRWWREMDALLLVSKLDNYRVQAALSRLGFRLLSAEYSLHRADAGRGVA